MTNRDEMSCREPNQRQHSEALPLAFDGGNIDFNVYTANLVRLQDASEDLRILARETDPKLRQQRVQYLFQELEYLKSRFEDYQIEYLLPFQQIPLILFTPDFIYERQVDSANDAIEFLLFLLHNVTSCETEDHFFWSPPFGILNLSQETLAKAVNHDFGVECIARAIPEYMKDELKEWHYDNTWHLEIVDL
jgi:hypothetical protein